MSILGIDVSYGNTVNWNRVRADGFGFAMIKASHGFPDGSDNDRAYKEYLVSNVAAANDAGIVCGVYHFATATNTNTSLSADNYSVETQAKFLVDSVEDAGGFGKIKLPLCIDIEGGPYTSMKKSKLTNIVKAFALCISKRRYVPCLYLDNDYRVWKYEMSEFGDLPCWYARWGKTQDIVFAECPTAFFWQTGTTETEGVVTYDSVQKKYVHTVDADTSIVQLMPQSDPEKAVYNYMQARTDASLYIDYCEKTVYVPTRYSSAEIQGDLRPLPNCTYFVYDTYITIFNGTSEHQRFDIVRI